MKHIKKDWRSTPVKHGLRQHPVYIVWDAIKQRCDNPNHKSYKIYGGAGIKLDSRWYDFGVFFKEFGNGYKKGLSIDRIDNTKGYCPGNVRWADAKQQARNTRRNLIIEYRGEHKSLAEWCEILNLKYDTVYMRIKYYGKTAEEAFK
jgi:hypothetical protein